MGWQQRAETRAQIFIYLPVDFYPGLDFPDFQQDPLMGPWLLRSAIAQCPPLSLKSLCLGNASHALKAWGPASSVRLGGLVQPTPCPLPASPMHRAGTHSQGKLAPGLTWIKPTPRKLALQVPSLGSDDPGSRLALLHALRQVASPLLASVSSAVQ